MPISYPAPPTIAALVSGRLLDRGMSPSFLQLWTVDSAISSQLPAARLRIVRTV
jgi:hypothetical protein